MDKLTNKQIIIGMVLLCILFILFSNVLKGLGKQNTAINYNEVNAEQLIKYSVESYNREKFLTLKDIIMKVLDSYEEEKYKEYYDVLNEEYKKKMNKAKFNNVINKFYDNFKVYPENDEMYIEKDNVLIGIYEYIYGKNMYVCKLINNAYIGIQLDSATKQYNIFYIE